MLRLVTMMWAAASFEHDVSAAAMASRYGCSRAFPLLICFFSLAVRLSTDLPLTLAIFVLHHAVL